MKWRGVQLLRWCFQNPWWHETILVVMLGILLLVMAIQEPQLMTATSQVYLSRQLWEFAILALGMTCIIITGGIDLSIGSAMGMCAVAFGLTFELSQSLVAAVTVCLLAGMVGGALNGGLVAWLRVHPLIVTLATYAAFRGIAEGVSQGIPYAGFPPVFMRLATGSCWGIPYPGLIFVGLAAATAVMLHGTPTGRYLYAIGHAEQAARFSGVPVAKLKFLLYVWSGGLAVLATLVYVSRLPSAQADIGTGFELDVITAVVVGGTSIFGGRGNVLGTVLGLLLIHETRLFVAQHWQQAELKPIVVGTLLVVSVLIYQLSRRMSRGAEDRH